jgi:NAD-dependent SIR2 family protein deacetylase
VHASKLDRLAEIFRDGDVAVLSGAGLSTESGIPDYRGPSGLARRATPMTYQTFVGDAAARRRYWARSYIGWRTFSGAAPNAGHHAVTGIERSGHLAGIVTQNVDGLHQASGATGVIDLHGSLDRVICLDCGNTVGRREFDRRLREANPAFDARATAINPDGDVELDEADIADFRVIACSVCTGGMLKPDVVFFGESVPRDRIARCFDVVERSRALVVLGSSLTVMSGRRFVLRACKLGIPVAIVNQGVTRSDDVASLVIDAPLGRVLPELAERLSAAAGERCSADQVDARVAGEAVADRSHRRHQRDPAGLRAQAADVHIDRTGAGALVAPDLVQ